MQHLPQAKAAAMKMKFMAVNAQDGENIKEAVITLLTDTIAYQKAHQSDDPVDPWATPSSADTQPPVSSNLCIYLTTIGICKAYYMQVLEFFIT